jgi:hypothetical protein
VALLDIGSGMGLIHIVGNDNVTGNLSWWENPRETGGNARTETWVRRTITSAGAEGFSIETGALTQTGRMDVVVAQNENGPAGIQWYQAPADRRNGIWTNRMIDSSYLAVHHISVHDMNADGYNDIVVAEQEQAGGAPQISPLHLGIPSRVTIFLNDGTGNFTADVIATTGGQELVIGDMNGRGDSASSAPTMATTARQTRWKCGSTRPIRHSNNRSQERRTAVIDGHFTLGSTPTQ